MTTTFEQAIADLKNVTMWNIGEHGPIIVAGLNDLAKRLQALEKKAASANLPNNSR